MLFIGYILPDLELEGAPVVTMAKEIRCKSFAAKDTAKERYLNYCKLDWLQ
jgi:hypothetical protein